MLLQKRNIWKQELRIVLWKSRLLLVLAPGSANTGTGIEVVVEQGGTVGNVVTPIKK